MAGGRNTLSYSLIARAKFRSTAKLTRRCAAKLANGGFGTLACLGVTMTPKKLESEAEMVVSAPHPAEPLHDLRDLSERTLRGQADEFSSMIDSIRNYYAGNVVGRVLAHGEKTQVLPNYTKVPGAIPIPATLSLELGGLISNVNTQFRFFSDYPFKNRASHAFDAFERQALEKLRQDPNARLYDVSGAIFDRRVRLVTPILMAAPCVNCHNSHPDSPKRDWKVGDVRGIEEFIINQPIVAHIFTFKYLLLYFAFVAITGLAFIGLQSAIHADRPLQQGVGTDQ
jgi:hypothetical protein